MLDAGTRTKRSRRVELQWLWRAEKDANRASNSAHVPLLCVCVSLELAANLKENSRSLSIYNNAREDLGWIEFASGCAVRFCAQHD